MKNVLQKIFLLGILIFNSCQPTEIDESIVTNPSNETKKVLNRTTICGEVKQINLIAGQNYVAGTISISNNATNIYVTYNTVNGWKINKTHLYVGACDMIPLTNSGNPKIGQFPYQTTHSPAVTTYTYTIPYTHMSRCLCILSHAEVFRTTDSGTQFETAWGEGEQLPGNSWAMKYNYCLQYCNEECVINPGDYRTQTQGGWGSVPNGNNPGAYLHNNFSQVFPNGLTVGCNSGYTLSLTTANAIRTFLPQGGTPSKLTQSYINPTTINNVLAGQIVALTISVKFDYAIANFGNSSYNLGDLVVASGTFQGMTVNQVLSIANSVFGGCSNQYTPAQINEILSSINENFVDGVTVGTALLCPNGE